MDFPGRGSFNQITRERAFFPRQVEHDMFVREWRAKSVMAVLLCIIYQGGENGNTEVRNDSARHNNMQFPAKCMHNWFKKISRAWHVKNCTHYVNLVTTTHQWMDRAIVVMIW